jgi:DNA-binding MarR family transcriptional regulator
LISNNNISAVKVNKVLDEFGLDLGNLPDMVGVELRMGQILAERAFSEVSHTQVSPGLFMILALVRNNPGQKQTTLAGSVRLDRSTMVSIMDHCERQGWVERKPYAGDRRAHSIIITRKGEQLVQKLEQDVLLLEKKIAARMGQSERDQLLRLLKKFHTAVID